MQGNWFCLVKSKRNPHLPDELNVNFKDTLPSETYIYNNNTYIGEPYIHTAVVDIVGRQGDTQKSDRQVLVGRQLVLTGK